MIRTTLRSMTKLVLLGLGITSAEISPNRCRSQEKYQPKIESIGSLESLDPAFDNLLAADAKVEVLGEGFDWLEGPVWLPKEDKLLFSEIPPNLVMQWTESAGVSIFEERVGYTGEPADGGREPGTNGLALSPTGQLYACCHGDRCIKRRNADGSWEIVVDRFEGRRFNSPNDLVFAANGDVYFTDPPYGLPDKQTREIDFCGVYRWDGKQVTLVTKELNRPNGIGLSPDGRTLYVAQSDGKAPIWMSYPVAEDGTVGEGKIFVDTKAHPLEGRGAPDGLAIDASGNIWGTGPGGVWVISPEGKVLGRILTGQATSNCTFGGPDNSWLFITADMYVCRIKTKTMGFKSSAE